MRRTLTLIALLSACRSDLERRQAFAQELSAKTGGARDAWVDDKDGIELVIAGRVCNAERAQRLAESHGVRSLGFVLVKCEGGDPFGVRDE